jgi:phage major head subunit gpT-like protein
MSIRDIKAKLAAANKGYRAVFFAALEQSAAKAQAITNLIAMHTESTGTEEDYDWLGSIPKMTEWTRDRSLARLRADGFTIKNKRWANGVAISRDVVEDDKLGIVTPRIQGMAEAAARHQKNLIVSLLNNAFTSGVAYDGQVFCSASHKDGDGPTQSNLVAHTLDATYYQTARQQMMDLKDEEGENLDMEPTHLIVSTNLEKVGKDILQAERLASGATNVQKGTAELLVLKGLSDSTAFLCDLTKVLKPVILQHRSQVGFTSLNSPDDYNVFMRNEFYFGAEYRGNAGYGFWQAIQGLKA